jgi:hypothetical protein
MFELLDLEEAGGQVLAQLVLCESKGGLGGALGLHFATQANDGGGLAITAFLECLQAFFGIGGSGFLHLKALMLPPEQQGQDSRGCD